MMPSGMSESAAASGRSGTPKLDRIRFPMNWVVVISDGAM